MNPSHFNGKEPLATVEVDSSMRLRQSILGGSTKRKRAAKVTVFYIYSTLVTRLFARSGDGFVTPKAQHGGCANVATKAQQEVEP